MPLCFVCDRYPAETRQGRLLRSLVQRLAAHAAAEVLTTCAESDVTWEDRFPPGARLEDGVTVHRFRVDFVRRVEESRRLAEALRDPAHTAEDERRWCKQRGPFSGALLAALAARAAAGADLVLVGHLSALTQFAPDEAQRRAVLVPWVRWDDPPAWELSRAACERARARALVAPEEWYPGADEDAGAVADASGSSPSSYPGAGEGAIRGPGDGERAAGFGLQASGFRVGVAPAWAEARSPKPEASPAPRPRIAPAFGIEPPPTGRPGSSFRARFGIEGAYAFTQAPFGALHEGAPLVRRFARFQQLCPGALKLVVAGRALGDAAPGAGLLPVGPLSPVERREALREARVFLADSGDPARLAGVLEAWSEGTPVLADARAPALAALVRRCEAGLWYDDDEQFLAALELLAARPDTARALGAQGRARVRAEWDWAPVLARWREALAG